MSERAGEDVKEIAARAVRIFEESGYGTPRGVRWTPTFDPCDVLALAQAVLADA